MYDLFADFYLKSSDSQPKITVPMGSYYPKTIGEMDEIGFIEDKDSVPGYLDYFMEADQIVLERLTQDGFESEILDALFSGGDWGKILIRAVEVEVMDDNGNYPPKGLIMGDTFVHYDKTNPFQKVSIFHGNPFEKSGKIPGFEVSVCRLKQCMETNSLLEALKKMQDMVSEKGWTYKEFRKCLKPVKNQRITLREITPAFGMGEYIAFTLKDIFERRAEIKDYDPIVMFVKRNGDVLEYWFDRAHVAETLAPMSLWEIKDEERKEWFDWLNQNSRHTQLEKMLAEYAEAIASIEKP